MIINSKIHFGVKYRISMFRWKAQQNPNDTEGIEIYFAELSITNEWSVVS